MFSQRKTTAAVLTLVMLCGCLMPALAAPPSKTPIIPAGDRDQLLEHLDERVIVTGVIDEAAWSSTGKVMNITFKDASDGLLAVLFSSQRERFDEAFGGDVAKTLTGKQVRLVGTVELYGGYEERLKGRPQIIINSDNQITLVTEEMESAAD